MVEKQLPGVEMVYMVYDYRDRLGGIQDGELRINNEWIYTKYDILNKPVITLRLDYTFSVQPREYYEVPTSTGYGYSDQSYPPLNQGYPYSILTATYYDNYDHSGRLIETSVSADQATPVVLAQNTFNELGEMIEKELHLDGQSAGLQRINYGYNIRGWLTEINDINDLSTDGDYFAMNLPEKVYEIGGVDDEISYIYDASGVKWLKKVDNGSMTNIAYCGSFVYMDAGATGTYELDYVLNSEGRIEFDQSGHTFHYLVKDHLGNTRVEFDEDQNVNQQVDYYPSARAVLRSCKQLSRSIIRWGRNISGD